MKHPATITCRNLLDASTWTSEDIEILQSNLVSRKTQTDSVEAVCIKKSGTSFSNSNGSG